MANRWGKQWKQWETLILGGFKIPADGDCSHEIKRLLLLGRKATSNLDSILKIRDITLLTKVHIVKAMAFLVVMYRFKSWIIKKAECWRVDAFKLWYWRRLFRVPWTARSNQSVLKEINPEHSLEGLMLKVKLQYFGHLMQRVESLEKTLLLTKTEGRRRRWSQRTRWLEGITELSGHEFEQTVGDGEGQGSLECCSPWGCKESDMTEWLNWTEHKGNTQKYMSTKQLEAEVFLKYN